MSKKNPVFNIDKVRLLQLSPIFHEKDGKKVLSKSICHASIDFGFFIIDEIGIGESYENDHFRWVDFGISRFTTGFVFNGSSAEVIKLGEMVKEELMRHDDEIMEFFMKQLGEKMVILDVPRTMDDNGIVLWK